MMAHPHKFFREKNDVGNTRIFWKKIYLKMKDLCNKI